MHFKSSTLIIGLLVANLSYAVVIDKIQAIVNDDVITESEVYAIKNLALDISALPPRENVLQHRIDQKLVLQQIEKQPPLEIPEDEIQSTLETYAAKHGGMEEVLVFLNSIGMNYADFEQEIRDQFSVAAFIRIRFRPFISIRLEDAEKYYNEVYKPRLQKEGKEVPSFEDSLDAVQAEMVESGVRQRAKEWLDELRASANITIKV